MSLFKAYDIRGTVPVEFNEQIASRIAHAFCVWLTSQHTDARPLHIALARDNRTSSDLIHAHIKERLVHCGVSVIDCGEIPTPVFYYAVSSKNLDGGIQITASHNPAEFNGMKLVREQAIPVGKESGMEEIEMLYSSDLPAPSLPKGSVEALDIMPDYVTANLTLVPPQNLPTPTIVIDAGNGVSASMCRALFTQLDAQLIPIFFESDGTFPNRAPDPLKPGSLSALQTSIKEHGAWCGFALDADGDRIVALDERGAIIPSDILTALLAERYLTLHPNSTIGYDVRSGRIVPEIVSHHGGKAIMTKVGHALIKNHMRTMDISFSGELSGHFYFKDIGYYEAPLLVILHVLNLLSERALPLSSLIAPLKKYFASGELNFTVLDKVGVMENIMERYADAPSLSRLDGVRADFPDWWFNVRPSNTEDVIRLTVEARSLSLLEEKTEQLTALIAHT